MKIGLVGGKTIKKYTIADYLWKEIGIVAEHDLNFTVYPIKDNQILNQFWHDFEKDDEFRGFNIALPWKQTLIERVSQDGVISKEARFKSINVIYKNENGISCENTDVLGIEKALSKKGGYADKNILVLGAGGVGIPTSLHLASTGAHCVYLFDIIKKEISFNKVRIIDSFHEISKYHYEIIINATPRGKFFLGKVPDCFCSPISFDLFRKIARPGTLAVDLNYLPVFTEFLNIADFWGMELITGLELLVRQAVESFHFYTNKNLDDDKISLLFHRVANYSKQKEEEIIKNHV